MCVCVCGCRRDHFWHCQFQFRLPLCRCVFVCLYIYIKLSCRRVCVGCGNHILICNLHFVPTAFAVLPLFFKPFSPRSRQYLCAVIVLLTVFLLTSCVCVCMWNSLPPTRLVFSQIILYSSRKWQSAAFHCCAQLILTAFGTSPTGSLKRT